MITSTNFCKFSEVCLQMIMTGYIIISFLIAFRALSSIMVLCWPCPYPMFTKREWKEITNVNPYVLNEPPLSHEISLSLYNATRIHLVNKNSFMDCGSSDLSRAVACSFNDL